MLRDFSTGLHEVLYDHSQDRLVKQAWSITGKARLELCTAWIFGALTRREAKACEVYNDKDGSVEQKQLNYVFWPQGLGFRNKRW